jgi:hypothetical protein
MLGLPCWWVPSWFCAAVVVSSIRESFYSYSLVDFLSRSSGRARELFSLCCRLIPQEDRIGGLETASIASFGELLSCREEMNTYLSEALVRVIVF